MKLATIKIVFVVDDQPKRVQNMKLSKIEKYITFALRLIGIKNIDVIEEFRLLTRSVENEQINR